jgi:hypothetical protein
VSKSGVVHPPRSNPPLRSSSGEPIPCITPSTETNVVVVSFMVAVPFSLFDFVGHGTPASGHSHEDIANARLDAAVRRDGRGAGAMLWSIDP